MDSNDREIRNASDRIDRLLNTLNKDNRGEVCQDIATSLRSLNDHIAAKVWEDLHPELKRDINKVAKFFACEDREYRYIARFHNYMGTSLSHFTPDTDGAERLLIKYYEFLIRHKRLMKKRYNTDILVNIDKFLLDIDEDTKDYYSKIAAEIEKAAELPVNRKFDNYYINRVKTFYINGDIYYEVTLEPANDKPNKFNRITAFTKHEILQNYSVALQFAQSTVNVFNVDFPIEIIVEWKVSIRPCEFENYAKILNTKINVDRRNIDYQLLMQYMTDNYFDLIDIIDSNDKEFETLMSNLHNVSGGKYSSLANLISNIKNILNDGQAYSNILRYLLVSMNNRTIKALWPNDLEEESSKYFIRKKAYAFDQMPFVYNFKEHRTEIHDLLRCFATKDRLTELLYRKISVNINDNGQLYTPIDTLQMFGDENEVLKLLNQFNERLYPGHKPNSELVNVENKYITIYGYENELKDIFEKLKQHSTELSSYGVRFIKTNIDGIEQWDDPNAMHDDDKRKSLEKMFDFSRVHFIYGAAGTGKSTLINYIAKLMTGTRKYFLAKTNPAVDNLRRKITIKEDSDEFMTVDRFNKLSYYYIPDLIVVDECSAVKNEDISKILSKMNEDTILVLAGDIYQIPAIGFGNWFSFAKNIISESNITELTKLFRTSDEGLIKLWKEYREFKEDNLILERLVREEYSHKIDDDIFKKKSDDEIILCLNYNGLYGLNNINKLMQLSNRNEEVEIGVWRFKKGDPILFNDSDRFRILYNNLKGTIIDIVPDKDKVYFKIDVDIILAKQDVEDCEGLDFYQQYNNKTTIGFYVKRKKQYETDRDNSPYVKVQTMPFQLAYAVSIHKAQGLEYDSVKIVISNDTEDKIDYNILYTAITRAKKNLTIYWSPEVCNRIIKKLTIASDSDYDIFIHKRKMI